MWEHGAQDNADKYAAVCNIMQNSYAGYNAPKAAVATTRVKKYIYSVDRFNRMQNTVSRD